MSNTQSVDFHIFFTYCYEVMSSTIFWKPHLERLSHTDQSQQHCRGSYKFNSGTKKPARLTLIDGWISLKNHLHHPKKRGSLNGIRNWKWRIVWILLNIWVESQVIPYILRVVIKPEILFLGVKETITF